MYAIEQYPELMPISHSANSMQKIGEPFAKLSIPPTFSGINSEVNAGVIKYKNCISFKTQTYSIGIVQPHVPLVFLGYTDIRQLGQYYSLTVKDNITRLYTATNFLSQANIELMETLVKVDR